jgi:RHS repeat-associated protein
MIWAASWRLWGAARKVWRKSARAAGGREGLSWRDDAWRDEEEGGAQAFYAKAEPALEPMPFRFPGQFEDAETGLYYNRHRHYDPLAGGYVSPDPIGLAGGDRPGGYVERPGCWTDPLGLAKAPNYAYRVIRDDENPALGLVPKDPSAARTANDHIRFGSRIETQFISVTKDEAVAQKWAIRDGKRYVRIDLNKVQSKIIDPLSGGLINNPLARNFATSSRELLIDGVIPRDAISILPQFRN